MDNTSDVDDEPSETKFMVPTAANTNTPARTTRPSNSLGCLNLLLSLISFV